MYKIYKHTMPDGKCYIGQTNQDKPYKRWQYGQGYVANKPFYQDIMLVGWNNITHEILEEVETKSEALKRERYYILLYRSNEPEYGYNSNINNNYGKQTFVRCVETGEIFESAAAVGKEIGRTKAAVSYAILHNKPCRGKHYERVLIGDKT